MDSEKTDLLTDQKKLKPEDAAKKTCKCLALSEPVLFLVGLGFFSFTPLNQEYLFDRAYKNVQDIVAQNQGNWSNISNVLGNHWSGESDVVYEYDNLTTLAMMAYASSHAAIFSSKTALFRCIPPIFTSILICSATDFFGRKFGMYFPIIGGIIRCICFLVVDINNLSLEWLFLGEFLDGVLGEHLTALSCCFAYISDTASKESLVFRFVVCSGLYFSASGLGNIVLGQVISYVGFLWGIVFIMSCYCSALLYVLFILPESFPRPATKTFRWSLLLQGPSRSYAVFVKERNPPSDRTALRLLLVGIILATSSILGVFDLETVYMLGSPFHMTADQIGIVIGVIALLWTFISPMWIHTLKRCVCDELVSVIITIICSIGYICQGLCVTTAQLFAAIAFTSFGVGSQQVCGAIMTNIADPSERGSIQACIASVSSFGELISKTVLLSIYAVTVNTLYHGTTHFVVAGTLCVCIVIYLGIWWIRRPCRRALTIAEMDIE